MQTDPGVVALVATDEPFKNGLTIGDVLSADVSSELLSGATILGTGRDALIVDTPSGLPPEQSVSAVIVMDAFFPDRVEALLRLWASLRGSSISPDRRVTRQQRYRLRRMLQAGDARHLGASYREIAIVLYGPARVAAVPWKTSSLRDAVIALVEDARRMIDGDYRKLLLRRRRSIFPL